MDYVIIYFSNITDVSGRNYRTRELTRELGKWAGNKTYPPKPITFLEISLN